MYDEALSLRESGLSYDKISKLTKIPKSTVWSWCSGKNKPRDAWTEKDHENYSKKCVENSTGRKLSEETKARMSAEQMGTLNSMWKGDACSKRSANDRARRWFGHLCPTDQEIHHIDGNPWNNEPENIEFLTRRGHMVKDGRLEKFKNIGKGRA